VKHWEKTGNNHPCPSRVQQDNHNNHTTAGNTTRIIPVQWHSNHPLYLRSLYLLLPYHYTRRQGHNYPHNTSSQSRIWAIHWATGKAWNTSTTMRLNLPSLWRSCDKHACNNCARSACVVNNSVCSQLSQALQASFNAN
jgi:hypothetical protein